LTKYKIFNFSKDTGNEKVGPKWQWYSYGITKGSFNKKAKLIQVKPFTDHNVPDELFDSSMMFNTDFELFYNLTIV